MHLVSFQNNSIFYNSYIRCIEQGVFKIERITFSRYYVANLEKCEIVFKLLASNCSTYAKKLISELGAKKLHMKLLYPEIVFYDSLLNFDRHTESKQSKV